VYTPAAPQFPSRGLECGVSAEVKEEGRVGEVDGGNERMRKRGRKRERER